MSARSNIAKAGWLYRESSVLHRWKRNWFELYRDGLLRYFDSQNSTHAEDVLVLRNVCSGIRSGHEIGNAKPPEELRQGRDCMIRLEMRDGKFLLLCAETPDDMRAWHFALEEARTMPAPGLGYNAAYPSTIPIGYTYERVGYGGYPGQVISANPPAPGAQVIQSPQGTTTIVAQPPQQVVYMDDDPYRYRVFGGGYHRHRYGRPGTTYVATPHYW